MNDIGIKEINEYVLGKHTRKEKELIDPATQPKKIKIRRRGRRRR